MARTASWKSRIATAKAEIPFFFHHCSQAGKEESVDFRTVERWLKFLLGKRPFTMTVVKAVMRLLAEDLSGQYVVGPGKGIDVTVKWVGLLGYDNAWTHADFKRYRKSVYKAPADRMPMRKTAPIYQDSVSHRALSQV